MFHLFVKFLNSSHGSSESAFAKDNVLCIRGENSLFPFADQNTQSFGLGNGQIDGNLVRSRQSGQKSIACDDG
jgi:hypothetical protein